MALAEVELVPLMYVVEDTSPTVTFWPAEVNNVKLDADTLLTVPAAPPEAGPDRALAPPPGPRPPAEPLADAVAGGGVAVAENGPQAASNPIAAHASAAAVTHRLLFVASVRSSEQERGRTVLWRLVESELFMMASSYSG
jgi:hypothetical protein